ncbi:MAG: hypothetical protein AAF696_38820 [Bacteroidota bacterium]
MKEIIEKYWKGESSLEEEKLLEKWLLDAPDTKENRELKIWLKWKESERAIQMQRLPEIPQAQKPEKAKVRRLAPTKILLSVAALICLLWLIRTSLVKPQLQKETPSWAYEDSFEDPEEAYKVTEEALLLLSTKMNTSKKHKKKLRKIHILSDLIESYTKD